MLGRQKVQIDRELLLTKIKRLQRRISMWCKTNGHENLGNTNEHRGDDGEIIWKQSDWEYVDDTYNQIVNNENYKPYAVTLKKMNKLWKKYNVY
jgi:hypothetical protein